MPNLNSSTNSPTCSSMHNIFTKCKTCIILLLLLSIPVHVSFSSTCSSSVSNQNGINTLTHKFSVSSTNYYTQNLGSVQGPISNSIYSIYHLYSPSPYYTVVGRVNADESSAWMRTINEGSYSNSLVVDSEEQYLYWVLFYYGWCIGRIAASNGDVVDVKKIGGLYISSFFEINLLSDNSGYYILLYDSGLYNNI